MPTPSPESVHLLAHVASVFTRPTFAPALALRSDPLLASGARTVTAAVRALGLADDRYFTT